MATFFPNICRDRVSIDNNKVTYMIFLIQVSVNGKFKHVIHSNTQTSRPRTRIILLFWNIQCLMKLMSKIIIKYSRPTEYFASETNFDNELIFIINVKIINNLSHYFAVAQDLPGTLLFFWIPSSHIYNSHENTVNYYCMQINHLDKMIAQHIFVRYSRRSAF